MYVVVYIVYVLLHVAEMREERMLGMYLGVCVYMSVCLHGCM